MMEMSAEFSQIMSTEPDNILDNLRAGDRDYGSRSGKWFCRDLAKSIAKHPKPHTVSVIAEPDSGKTHAIYDIAERLVWADVLLRMGASLNLENDLDDIMSMGYNLDDLIKRFGTKIPMDIFLWGDVISLAKIKGWIPMDVKYGHFRPSHLHAATAVLGPEIRAAIIQEQDSPVRQLRKAARVIYIETPATAGAFVDGRFIGQNRGLTTLMALAQRQGIFQDLDYLDWWMGWSAEEGIKNHAKNLENKLQEVGDSLEKIVEVLREENEKVSDVNVMQLRDYSQEGASVFASNLIEQETNELALKMRDAKKIRFNKYRFISNPNYRTRVVGNSLLKWIFQENLGIQERVFLGINTPKIEDGIAFHINLNIRNFLRSRYPEIEEVAKTNK